MASLWPTGGRKLACLNTTNHIFEHRNAEQVTKGKAFITYEFLSVTFRHIYGRTTWMLLDLKSAFTVMEWTASRYQMVGHPYRSNVPSSVRPSVRVSVRTRSTQSTFFPFRAQCSF